MASFVLVVEPPTKKARGVGDRSSGVHVQTMMNDAGEIVLGRQKGTIDVAFPLKMIGVGLGCSMSTQSRMLWQIEVEEYRDIARSVSLHMFGVTRGLFSVDAPTPTFESNIAYVLRFMIDTKVVGMNWIEIPAGKYSIVPSHQRKSVCQLEVVIRYDEFISCAPEGEWSMVAPLRILSFDIECAGHKTICALGIIHPSVNKYMWASACSILALESDRLQRIFADGRRSENPVADSRYLVSLHSPPFKSIPLVNPRSRLQVQRAQEKIKNAEKDGAPKKKKDVLAANANKRDAKDNTKKKSTELPTMNLPVTYRLSATIPSPLNIKVRCEMYTSNCRSGTTFNDVKYIAYTEGQIY
ncbi:hypothetical protein C8J57DRAFT_1253427 [Mycena rebaudengoi]|nr:hypothetical protein C8J57DRAFT_1253427 [Mycena rebaudengoi]